VTPRVEPGGRRWLAVGAVVSLLAHAGLAAAIIASPAASPRGEVSVDTSQLRQSATDSPRPVPPVKLGLENSRAVSVNWIGFEEPDPVHTADLESDVEQAALTTEAAGGPQAVRTAEQTADGAADADGRPMAEAEPTSPPPPIETPAERQVPPPAALAADTPSDTDGDVRPPAPSIDASAEPATPADAAEFADGVEPADDIAPEERLAEPHLVLPEPPVEPRPEPAVEPQPAAEPMGPPEPTAEDLATRTTPAAEPAREPQPPAAASSQDTQTARGVGGEQPGEASDRDSVAAALARAIDLTDWTKPIAGQGLEVRTVRPRWSLAVRATNWPNDPVVVIRFGPDGRVRRAEFLRDPKTLRVFDTGSGNDVDGPLLDAVYQWTAKGKRLAELDATRPDSVVEITIRVMLR
jgi:hypothetical protein